MRVTKVIPVILLIALGALPRAEAQKTSQAATISFRATVLPVFRFTEASMADGNAVVYGVGTHELHVRGVATPDGPTRLQVRFSMFSNSREAVIEATNSGAEKLRVVARQESGEFNLLARPATLVSGPPTTIAMALRTSRYASEMEGTFEIDVPPSALDVTNGTFDLRISARELARWMIKSAPKVLYLRPFAARAVVTSLLVLAASAVTRAQSVTVSISGTQVQWNTANGNPLNPGSAANAGNTPIVVTTTWDNLQPGGGRTLSLYAYFGSATAALVDTLCFSACTNIPSSGVELSINGAALAPINQTGPFGAAGASLQIFSLRITGSNKNGTRADTLNFNINLSTLPLLEAGTYTGTLFVQAQAIL
jgi:hypothetical protein